MKKIIMFLLMVFAINSFGQVDAKFRIRMADSTYSAQLIGNSGRTNGITVQGVYSTTFRAHEFIIATDGRYDLWFDPAGGTNYSKDTGYSYTNGRPINTGNFMDAVDTDYDNKIDALDNDVVSTTEIIDATIELDDMSAEAKAGLNGVTFLDTVSNYADTTLMKAATTSPGELVFLKKLSSSTNLGSGVFVNIASGYTANGITVFDATGGGYLVRQDYLNLSEIRTSWSGAISSDATNDHLNVQRAINALQDGDKLIFDGGGTYQFGRNNSTWQVQFNDKDNIVVEFRADIILEANTESDAGGATAKLDFIDCDYVTIEGNNHLLNGNSENQSGYTGGYGAGKGGINFDVSSQSTITNLTVNNLKIKYHHGVGIEYNNFSEGTYFNVEVDSVGEGLFAGLGNRVVYDHCRMGDIINQDGWQISGVQDITIRDCRFDTLAIGGSNINIHVNSGKANIHDNYGTMSIRMSADSLFSLSLHDNIFPKFYDTIAINSVTSGDDHFGKNEDYQIYNNHMNFMSAYPFIITGNTTYDMNVRIANNQMSLDANNSFANNNFFWIEGWIDGVTIENNVIYNNSIGLDRAIYGTTENSREDGGYKAINNIFYNFDQGIYSLGDSLDLIGNRFYGTNPDSIFFVFVAPYEWDASYSIIEDNGAEYILNSDDYTTTGVLTPVQGIKTYYLTDDVDSIGGATYMPYGAEITFVYNTSTNTLSSANNIALKDSLDWYSELNGSVTVKNNNGNWIEVNRAGSLAHYTYHPVDSKTEGFWYAGGGKTKTTKYVDDLHDFSGNGAHLRTANSEKPIDGGKYLLFDGVDDTLDVTVNPTTPGANSFCFDVVFRRNGTANLSLLYWYLGSGGIDFVSLNLSGSIILRMIDDLSNSEQHTSGVALDTMRTYVVSVVVDRTANEVRWYYDGEQVGSADDISGMTGNLDPTRTLRVSSTGNAGVVFDGELYALRYSVGLRSEQETKRFFQYAKKEILK